MVAAHWARPSRGVDLHRGIPLFLADRANTSAPPKLLLSIVLIIKDVTPTSITETALAPDCFSSNALRARCSFVRAAVASANAEPKDDDGSRNRLEKVT